MNKTHPLSANRSAHFVLIEVWLVYKVNWGGERMHVRWWRDLCKEGRREHM